MPSATAVKSVPSSGDGIEPCLSQSSMQTLSELREMNKLCDAVIRLEDGSEFPVHRAILSACSPYFRALFTTSLHLKDQTDVTIPGLKASEVNSLLKYAYLRKIDVNFDNVSQLLATADYLAMTGVIELCCSFLKTALSPKNCIGILKYARDHFHKELERDTFRYVMRNFVHIAQQSDEILDLTEDEIVGIIGSEELNVKNEEAVWEFVLRWINVNPQGRKVYIVSLVSQIRLGLMDTRYFLENVKEHEYITSNELCRPKIIDTLRFLYDLETITQRTGEVSTPEIARPRIPHEIMFAIGGWSGGSPTNYVETYDTRADRWVRVEEVDPAGTPICSFFNADRDGGCPDNVNETHMYNSTIALSTTKEGPRAYHGTAVVGTDIYVIGGFDGVAYFNSCRCFNAVTKEWRHVAPMNARRCYVSVAVINDIIYAMGGFDGQQRQDSVEKYDYRTNQWSMVAAMNAQRSDASATTLDNKIYITGGFNGHECMNTAEVYDPELDAWSLIAPMRSRRSGVSCVAYHGAIYVIGGFNGTARMNSGERYDPSKNTWTTIPEMYNPRSNFAIEVIDDMIFALGGFNGVTTIYHVECYDDAANEWYEATDMNIYRSALSASVIKELPNVRDYIHKRRDRLMEEKRLKLLALDAQRTTQHPQNDVYA